MTLKEELHFPHSLGLYSAITYFTGFKVNSGLKVMGLAPYGEPRYVQKIYDFPISWWLEDGSFRMNMEYFDYCAGLTMTNSRFEKLFDGPPRVPETNLTQRELDSPGRSRKYAKR